MAASRTRSHSWWTRKILRAMVSHRVVTETPGDALVLLEVPDIRPQLGMRHQPGMQPRRPLHPAPRRQQQERSSRQHRQEHSRHSQSQRHGTQYDQQIIHDSNSRPKSNKNHLSASSRPHYPSPFPRRQQNPRFAAVAASALLVNPLHRPLCGIFPPSPLSTTAAKPMIRCRCGICQQSVMRPPHSLFCCDDYN